MSWRTVVIAERCKLDLSMGYMVIRGEETKRLFLDELAVLIIENTAVSLTACLLATLTEKKIKVIFCDSRRNPCAELIPHEGSHDSSRKIRTQIAWPKAVSAAVWTEIVAAKITNQAELLEALGFTGECALLRKYVTELLPEDATNREGHAAKVYFNALFGMAFTRSADCPVNAALNYGYGLILSAFNREVSANGYLTQLGLHHDNGFNAFNLSCDLMEPFRILVDRAVRAGGFTAFGTEEKHALVALLNGVVTVRGERQTVLNAIKLYTKSVFDALNEQDISCIRFPKL